MNKRIKSNIFLSLGIILFVILLDQSLKIWVKTHMYIGESSYDHWHWPVKWFQIRFVENEGMAFGIKFGGDLGKLILTVLRIVVLFVLGVLIVKIIKGNYKKSLLILVSMIFAGALGNIIDSVFYGKLFSASYPIVYKDIYPPARFLPPEGGYADFFYGKVVDMLYFPLFEGTLPSWLPFFGGQHFIFFSAIFNIADATIFIAVVIIMIFYQKITKPVDNGKNQNSDT